jgi:esterase/lipase
VIVFAAQAVEMMTAESNLVVLLEGRAATVNYVRSPYRFELVLSDTTLIGQRRAAQRLMAAAKNTCDAIENTTTTTVVVTDEMVEQALRDALYTMVQEIGTLENKSS